MKNMSIYTHSHQHQIGFTLIELMISLVLGLIVSAAVIQVYLINVKTSSIQASASELQDASVFGLQQLEKKIRVANLGNPVTQLTDKTVNGGIVLMGTNLGITATPYSGAGYLTRRAGDTVSTKPGWTGISNTADIGSDQLTIQYRNITGTNMDDCEGNIVAPNDIAIERYFLRESTDNIYPGAIKNLVLACDAGRIDPTQADGIKKITPTTDLRNFGQAGQEFIVNVDQFKVLLGTQSTSASTAGQLMFMPSSAYLKITDDKLKPAIMAVKIGLIVHGSTPVIGSNDQDTFTVLNQELKLKADVSRKKQVRNTYESTTLLRNARVVNVSTSLQ